MKITQWLLTVTVLTAAFQASASDNTINFVGEVAASTCDVTVNGNSASPIVLLPTAEASDLADPNAVTGRTEFEVALTNCEFTQETSVSTVFVGNNVTKEGNLGNTGSAKNVELQILESNGSTQIDLSSGPITTPFTDSPFDTSKKDGSQKYHVQYISIKDGAPEPGTVLGSMQYAINYQ